MQNMLRCLLFLALVVVLGCGAKPKDLILGKWEAVDAKTPIKSVEFLPDGALKLPTGFKGIVMEGKYKIIGDDRLEIEHTLPVVNVLKVSTFKMAITRDTLVVTDDQGTKHEYKRVQ